MNELKPCPKCGKKLRYVESALYTGSNPSVHPFIPPHYRCDSCHIGTYDFKTWYNRRGEIKIEKEIEK